MFHLKKILAMAVAIAVVLAVGTASVSASSEVLKKESQGSSVTSLQKDLVKLGYLKAEDATGYFGNVTEQAIKQLQKEYGYESDGIAGETTLALVDRLRGRSTAATSKTTSKTTVNSSLSAKSMQEGDENDSVAQLQKDLIELGFLETNATGFFGPATTAAVKSLQKEYGYTADGIAGTSTLKLVSSLISGDEEEFENAESGNDASADEAAVQEDTDPKALSDFMMAWFGGVDKTFLIGDVATVLDIKSGLSFQIKRTYGHNHADCETLTAKDTATMKKIFGGAWSWDRRAVIVSANGVKLAGSMSGMPHAGLDKYSANKTVSSRSGGFGRGTNLDAVKNNGMNGVFDIHFYLSKNHYNNKIDPKHQALVKEAAKWAVEHLN